MLPVFFLLLSVFHRQSTGFLSSVTGYSSTETCFLSTATSFTYKNIKINTNKISLFVLLQVCLTLYFNAFTVQMFQIMFTAKMLCSYNVQERVRGLPRSFTEQCPLQTR